MTPFEALVDRARAAAVARRLLVGLVARPLHVGLFSLVAGLLAGPRVPGLAVGLAFVGLSAAAAGAALERRRGSRAARAVLEAHRRSRDDAEVPWSPDAARDLARGLPPLAVAAAVLVVAGATLGLARTAVLERTRLGPDFGHAITADVVLQDAPRRASFGGWSARAKLRGEPIMLRVSETGSGSSGGGASVAGGGSAGSGTPPDGAGFSTGRATGGDTSADAVPLPAVGAVLAVSGALRAPGDFASLLHTHAELRARTAIVTGRRGGLAGGLDRVRERAEAALDRGLPPVSAGLYRGMVLGQDDALPDAARDAFRAAGLSHLVAASGTNVVLLATFAMALGTAVGLGLTGRLWLVLVLIVVYVPLAGGGASIQRAGVMGAAAVAAGLVGRPASRWYALGLAAAVTLALDPRAAADPGWQLSFVAVLSLLLLAPRWRTALVRLGAPVALADVTAMTGAATLATAPVIAAHFGQASLVGVPANLLAAPAVAPVMWLGVSAAALGQLAALGGVITAVLQPAIDGLDALAGFPLGYLGGLGGAAARAPGAVVHAGPWLVLVVVATMALALSSAAARRRLPAAVVVAAALWLALAPAPAAPAGVPAGLRLTFLDVGQGDATLLQDRDRSVLVDAGLPDAGIVRLLRRAGVARLDLLVITHADADHVGGGAAVVDAVPVGAILDGRDGVRNTAGDALAAAAAARRVRLLLPAAGQQLRVGGLRLRVLWPRPEAAALHAGADPNDRAIVLEVDAEGRRALLGADAESDVLSRLDLEPVDVLKVSHHGSADPGLPALLVRLHPQIAGIEVGAGNTYGHPAPSTLAALAVVPTVFRTDRDGTVRLDLTADGGWAVRAHA